MINDEYIIKKLFTTSCNKLFPGYQKIIDNNEEIKKYLLNRYEYSDSFAETLWRIKLHIENRPTCSQCGKPVKYYKAGKFSEFCSVKCAMNSDKVKNYCKQRIQEKYGVDNVYQSEIIKNKIKQTNIERYGSDSYLKTEECKIKAKETSLRKYGTERPYMFAISDKQIINGIKNSGLGYGVSNFRPTIAKFIFEKYLSDREQPRIFDYSAGWVLEH